MAKCDFYKYDGKDCCILKGQINGQDNDRVSNEIYNEYCRYTDEYKNCPYYIEFKKK